MEFLLLHPYLSIVGILTSILLLTGCRFSWRTCKHCETGPINFEVDFWKRLKEEKSKENE